MNGMMYVRGQQADYDALAAAVGGHQWGWDSVLPAFRALEDHSLGASAVRGVGGPVGVTVPTATDDETVQLFLESAQKAGWGFVEDVNAQDEQQVGFTPSTIRNGIRQSTANTFLWAARHRKNLTIATGTTVGRLRFDGKRVVGVTARRGNRLVDYTARKEVVVSAGAIETPNAARALRHRPRRRAEQRRRGAACGEPEPRRTGHRTARRWPSRSASSGRSATPSR